VQLELNEAERMAGLSVNCLEDLARAQDSDAFIAQLYIMSALAPATAAHRDDNGHRLDRFR
jgi:hypothetical protein